MSSSLSTRTDPTHAQQLLTEHRFYRYRGCAPDPDDPRVAAGDNGLSVDAWQAPDTDGGEDQEARNERVRAAKAVCGRCPVKAACLAYGASVTAEGKLAERHSILGGLTAVERTKALVLERQVETVVVKPAPVDQLRTPQKVAVLRALASHVEPEAVAAAAGMDLRTTNWQRSRLATQLGLGRSASREALLEAAVARGLLEAGEVAGGLPAPASVPAAGPVLAPVSGRGPGRRSRARRRVAVFPGQLSLDDALPPPLAPVIALFPSLPVLEAAV